MHAANKEKFIGSLFGDIEYMAEYINIARTHRDVTVWLNTQAELVCDDVNVAPDLPPERLLGTYGLGGEAADIQQDLIVFRGEHTSNAIIF